MSDLSYVGTLNIGNIAKVRVHAPVSRNLSWFSGTFEAIEQGYTSFIDKGVKSWVIYGKDLESDLGVIRGNLDISREFIPEEAKVAVLNGEYIARKNSDGLGDIIVNSVFLKKQKAVEPRIIEKVVEKIVIEPKIVEKVITRIVPRVITKVVYIRAENLSDARHTEYWRRLRSQRLCGYSS